MTGTIRVGIGGWTFPPWRGIFYPEGLAQKRELEYASRHLTSIEINGTYYGSQKPESFARWREETPEGFVFALKGRRFSRHSTGASSPRRNLRSSDFSRVASSISKKSSGRSIGSSFQRNALIPPISKLFSSCCRGPSKDAKFCMLSRFGTKDFEPRSSSICCVPTKPAWPSRTKTRFRIFPMSRRRSFTFACRGHRKGRGAKDNLRRRLIYGRRVRSLGPGATSQRTSNQ